MPAGPDIQPSADHQQTVAVASSRSVRPREFQAGDWFRDVSVESGVDFAYRNGREGNQYTLLETVGGGVALLDYDVDGDLDLFFCGGGSISAPPGSIIRGLSSVLYRNDGNWKFTEVTRESGLSDSGDYTHGVAVADYDRDGFPDLFVTAFGRSRLWKNDHGVFRDVTETAGLSFTKWSTAAAWADIDRDSYPDLYVAGYVDWSLERHQICGDPDGKGQDVCPPQNYPGASDHLFRNRGNGTFEDRSLAAGLKADDRGLGVLSCDMNGDGWVDFYVANDGQPNRLFLGGSALPLQEAGLWSGVATGESGLAEGSMGVDAGDYNGDGLVDLFVTNFQLENNSLYRGSAGGFFSHATVATGLAGSCFPFVGFGTGLVDFNLDGWLDLFVVNGNVFYHVGQRPLEQPAFLFRNENGKRYRDVTEQGGPYFSVSHVGRGAAVGDLDNDGDLDLVVVHQNERVSLLQNQLQPKEWLRVQLEGVRCDREAVGAKVAVSYRGRQLIRWVRSGAGYLSQFDARITFPAESDAPASVTVQWPGGDVEIFPACQRCQNNVLIEGHGNKPAKNQTGEAP